MLSTYLILPCSPLSLGSSSAEPLIVADGEHHVFPGLEELLFLRIGGLQPALIPVLAFQVTMDEAVQQESQQGNGYGNN